MEALVELEHCNSQPVQRLSRGLLVSLPPGCQRQVTVQPHAANHHHKGEHTHWPPCPASMKYVHLQAATDVEKQGVALCQDAWLTCIKPVIKPKEASRYMANLSRLTHLPITCEDSNEATKLHPCDVLHLRSCLTGQSILQCLSQSQARSGATSS